MSAVKARPLSTFYGSRVGYRMNYARKSAFAALTQFASSIHIGPCTDRRDGSTGARRPIFQSNIFDEVIPVQLALKIRPCKLAERNLRAYRLFSFVSAAAADS